MASFNESGDHRHALASAEYTRRAVAVSVPNRVAIRRSPARTGLLGFLAREVILTRARQTLEAGRGAGPWPVHCAGRRARVLGLAPARRSGHRADDLGLQTAGLEDGRRARRFTQSPEPGPLE